jgi:cation diffusion facilitator CzcD-associated flavoprotein CzcO
MVKFRRIVTQCIFDNSSSTWLLHVCDLDTGKIDEERFKYVIASSAPLSEPVLPTIPGREIFLGETWHTARWPEGVRLDGKRVAIIGTGASAIQIVPEIVKIAAEVTVYQRTTAWVSPRWGT